MPKIIYKQRHTEQDGLNKGRKFTPARNAGFVKYIGEREHILPTSHEERLVKYIGEREHVEHRLEAPNGLFGVINGRFSDNYSTSEMQYYVRKMSTPHRNIFHSVFSFTTDSAKEAGLNTLADWENWVKYHTSEIAKNMNVKIENFEYLAAVHLKENQPHVHIIWWDKEQQIYINKVEDVICDQIRIDVTKSTYRDLFNDIYNKEEVMRRELRKSIGTFTANNVLKGAADDYSMQIMARIQGIAEALPPKGQLKYKYQKLGSRAKTELDNLTHYIINNNEQFKAQYDEIREQRQLYNKLLHSDTSDYGSYQADLYMKKLDDKIENAVGNEILRIIKSEMKAGRMTIGTPSERYDIIAEPEYGETERLPEDDTATLEPSAPPNRTRYKIQWSDEFKQAKQFAKNENYEKALELYKKEAARGNVLAIYEIADLYRRELLVGEEPDKYYKLALEGFLSIEPNTSLKPYVQYRIGRMYYDGYGTDKDFKTAFNWLKKAADGENHNAEYTMLYHGTGTTKDTKAAIKYMERASAKLSAACVTLGDIALKDNKEEEAIDWYSKAVDMSNADGAYKLHQIFRKQEDMQDMANDYLDTAITLYEKQRDIRADLMLGKIYADIETPKFDFPKAENLLLKAATFKDIDISSMAEYPLAKLYINQGVQRYTDALLWLEKAFAHGNNYSALAAAKILSDNEYQQYDVQAAKDWLGNALQRTIQENNPANNELIAELNYKLGKLYSMEDGYNPKLAEVHLKRAVAFGNAYAMYALAQLYIHDTTTFNKPDIAVMLLNNAKAANPRISPLADYTLGTMYLYNDKVKDIALAKRHLTASANAGNEHARMVLESFTANSVIKLINSTGRLLAENSEMTNAALNQCAKSVFGRGDLSKEQIKELLLKLSDKENTAEM